MIDTCWNNHKILFVDDDPDDQYLMSAALKKLAATPRLVCVYSGDEMFAHLANCVASEAERMPSLILLDLNMPGVDGREILVRLKQTERYELIPVVVYTTSNSTFDVAEVYRLGANSFIRKPGKLTDIVTVLETVCRYWFEVVDLTLE